MLEPVLLVAVLRREVATRTSSEGAVEAWHRASLGVVALPTSLPPPPSLSNPSSSSFFLLLCPGTIPINTLHWQRC